eukprot:Sdes_comp19125_c0_seq1m9840
MSATASCENEVACVASLHQYIANDPEMPIAIAAIKVLIDFIRESNATTMMELRGDLVGVVNQLTKFSNSAISVTSGCELFMRSLVRASYFSADFKTCKQTLIARGIDFAASASASKSKIAKLSYAFIRDGATILTHSYSRVVIKILLEAAAKNRRFKVYVTESQPDCSGLKTAQLLQKVGIPVTVVLDAAVGFVMEKVDFVIVGAEGVVESGGIVNKIGTYPIATCAKSVRKPFYAVAESFKFVRQFPINQADLPLQSCMKNCLPDHLRKFPIDFQDTIIDYTPPTYIDLLFTDLGVLTPSAVSDELIKLYY